MSKREDQNTKQIEVYLLPGHQGDSTTNDTEFSLNKCECYSMISLRIVIVILTI